LAKKVYGQIPKFYHINPRLSNSLLDALIKCGDCSNAEILHSKMEKSVTSYGNLMSGFNKANNPENTLNLLNQMKIDRIEPNLIIYLCVIKALSKIGDYLLSESTIEQIPNSILVDHRIQNALIDMWVGSYKFYSFFSFTKII
jgi:pentatricopeptide repeat protein